MPVQLISHNDHLQSDYYRIGISGQYPQAVAGQFVMLRFQNQLTPLLSRPFSIHRLTNDGIEILYKVVGDFTTALTKLKPDDQLHILGPLGHGFKLPPPDSRIFLVAGGIGIAPLRFLIEDLKKNKFDLKKSYLFLGGRTNFDLLMLKYFADQGLQIFIATDDGSKGTHGVITQVLEKTLLSEKPAVMFACGPMPMLKEVKRLAATFSTPCQISIETLMACGIGACLGCALKTTPDSLKRLHVCIDGPVFNSESLEL